jgi:tRNA pseudouridine13 synthase
VRPTFIAKAPLELKEDQVMLAFVPACVKVKPEGYMTDLILSLFRKEGLEPPFKNLENLGLGGRMGLLRQLAFKPRELSYSVKDDALEMEFSLPKSSYATVLLREVMKPEDPILAGF